MDNFSKYLRKETFKYEKRRNQQVDLFYVKGRPIFFSTYDDIQVRVQKNKIMKMRKKNKRPPFKF
jgi:hypothetical protein